VNTYCTNTILINHTNSTTQAKALAQQLNLPIKLSANKSTQFILHLTDKGISLQLNAQSPSSPVRVEFASGKAAYRRGQPELLTKAVGLNKRKSLQIVDATAGLGRDAFVLATQGCHVTLIERHPLIHLLLSDGIKRAHENGKVSKPASNMTLVHANALNWLAQNTPSDVIYLDPMYPASRKSALVKKEMQLFHALLDDDKAGEARLLESALQAALYRVVVKRPIKGNQLKGIAPDFTVNGRSTRFDIYQNT
jgi:16S rRNA (guanine1516-N2)-methyltransferase